MATRALIKFFRDDNYYSPLACLYIHNDGYPTGLGASIKNNLQGSYVYAKNYELLYPRRFNGMGCLAAYLTGALKDGWGHCYLSDGNHSGIEYEYHLTTNQVDGGYDERPWLRVFRCKDGAKLYDGWVDDYDPQQEEPLVVATEVTE